MNNNTYVHKYLNGLIGNNDITVDMTCGGGNDTLFLCKHSKKVFGFDIQESAINETRERCKTFDNLVLINDSHINVDRYLLENPKLFIFNIGYYPKGDHNIISKAEDTLVAFKKAYSLLAINGYIVISFYIGHKGGKEEYYLLKDYIDKNNLFVIDKYRQYKNIDEPITYVIKKRP